MDNPESLIFFAKIPMDNMGTWFRAGTQDQSYNRMRLKLKVWMSIEGVEVFRDMAVIVIGTHSGGGLPGYLLEGSV